MSVNQFETPGEPPVEKVIMSSWEGGTGQPVVSVVCITFNQEKYIFDAINSFLSQVTSFPFEIIIHDDVSSDSTRAIISDYASRYPNIIRPVLQTENQFTKGKQPTFIAAKMARGHYIALCEGDDFWTTTDKLQKQVDFLNGNPDCSAVTHQTIKFFESDICEPQPFSIESKPYWELDDLIFVRKYHTASIMARVEMFKDHEFPDNVVSCDKAMSFLFLSYGKIGFLPDVMGVYRKNEGGISSWVTVAHLKGDLNLLPWLKGIYPDFPVSKYRSIIHGTVCDYPPRIGFVDALKHYVLFSFFSFSYFPDNLIKIARVTKGLLMRFRRGGFSGL